VERPPAGRWRVRHFWCAMADRRRRYPPADGRLRLTWTRRGTLDGLSPLPWARRHQSRPRTRNPSPAASGDGARQGNADSAAMGEKHRVRTSGQPSGDAAAPPSCRVAAPFGANGLVLLRTCPGRISKPAEQRLPPLFLPDPPDPLDDDGGEITLEQPPRAAPEQSKVPPIERDADLGGTTRTDASSRCPLCDHGSRPERRSRRGLRIVADPLEDAGVGRASKAFVPDRVGLMAGRAQVVEQLGAEILVQLDLHAGRSGRRLSSRPSSAARAKAASI
jgi:hypothetical protein